MIVFYKDDAEIDIFYDLYDKMCGFDYSKSENCLVFFVSL